MAPRPWFVLPAACGLLVLAAASAMAAETVKIKGVHLCCASCVKGVDAALKAVEGVAAVSDPETSTITLTARSNDILQHALESLNAAGFNATIK
jgi:copper chaperone CopZ